MESKNEKVKGRKRRRRRKVVGLQFRREEEKSL